MSRWAGSFWQFLEPERPLDCRSCHEILENSYMSQLESYRKFLTENLEKNFFIARKSLFWNKFFLYCLARKTMSFFWKLSIRRIIS